MRSTRGWLAPPSRFLRGATCRLLDGIPNLPFPKARHHALPLAYSASTRSNGNGYCKIHSHTAVAKWVAFAASANGEIADTSGLDFGWCFG